MVLPVFGRGSRYVCGQLGFPRLFPFTSNTVSAAGISFWGGFLRGYAEKAIRICVRRICFDPENVNRPSPQIPAFVVARATRSAVSCGDRIHVIAPLHAATCDEEREHK